MAKTTYSYSRLTTFEQCNYSYFKQYILKENGSDNVYSLLGSVTHDVVEALQENKMTIEEGLNKFDDEWELARVLGFKFISNKVEENYIASIRHYIANFEPIHGTSCEIEKKIELDVDGHKLVGYIDLVIHNSDGTVSIYDFKTSSKFEKSKLDKYGRQLVIYALAMEQLGYKVRNVHWAMIKYASIAGKGNRTKTVQRSEIDLFDECQPLFVTYEITEENKQKCKEWIVNTIEEIESKDELFGYWEENYNSFFCQNLCNYGHCCERCKKEKRNYWNK